MQPLYLKAGVYLAAVGDDLISLDALAGDYACLPGLGRAFAPPGPDGWLDVSSEAAESLLQAGLAGDEPQAGGSRTLPPSPTASCWRAQSVELTRADGLRFARACLEATPRFWRASFQTLIQRPGPSRAAAPLETVQRDAQAFDQMAPFAPFQGECLFRSFLLLAFLRLEAREATWVFGVRTYPFRAHCWLQVGEVVLDDAVERVCAYVPILAV
jgi:hypothetical protein